MRRGYITPGLKIWATALCRDDPASLDDVMARAAPVCAHLSRALVPRTFPDPVGTRGSTAPKAQAVCAQLGLPPGTLQD